MTLNELALKILEHRARWIAHPAYDGAQLFFIEYASNGNSSHLNPLCHEMGKLLCQAFDEDAFSAPFFDSIRPALILPARQRDDTKMMQTMLAFLEQQGFRVHGRDAQLDPFQRLSGAFDYISLVASPLPPPVLDRPDGFLRQLRARMFWLDHMRQNPTQFMEGCGTKWKREAYTNLRNLCNAQRWPIPLELAEPFGEFDGDRAYAELNKLELWVEDQVGLRKSHGLGLLPSVPCQPQDGITWRARPFDFSCADFVPKDPATTEAVRAIIKDWDGENWEAIYHALRVSGYDTHEVGRMTILDVRMAFVVGKNKILHAVGPLETHSPSTQKFEAHSDDEASPQQPAKLQRITQPSDLAIAAYRLHFATGARQADIAKTLQTSFGRPVNQGQVSRWIATVEKYVRAGNILPDPPKTPRTVRSVDPQRLDLGARTDGRSHQRPHRQSE